MAEYIDRKKIKKSYYFQTKGGVFPKSELFVKRDDIFDMPTADVIEREKIDKAIEEMERYSTSFEYANRHDLASVVDCCIGMIQKNIGEKK